MIKQKISVQDIKFTDCTFGALSIILILTGLIAFMWHPKTEITTDDPKIINVQNRYGLNVVVSIDIIDNSHGLVFVAHGFGGNKEDDNILSLARTFNNHGYSAIRFDATNSTGQSDGDLAYASPSAYKDDLFDIITWAKTQEWYQEPFYICGYSLGALSATIYAEQYSEEIKGLILISPLVAGQFHLADALQRDVEEWKQLLQQLHKLYSQHADGTHIIRWLPIILDLMKFDLTQSADKLIMPVLIVAGEEDLLAPPNHQQKLLEAINGNVELAVIKQGDHFFKQGEHLEALVEKVDNWLATH